jgi:hypothetical protein
MFRHVDWSRGPLFGAGAGRSADVDGCDEGVTGELVGGAVVVLVQPALRTATVTMPAFSVRLSDTGRSLLAGM